MATFQDLPPELWPYIIDGLDRPGLKAARLTCRAFECLATRPLFRHVRVFTNRESFDRLHALLKSPKICSLARTLTYNTKMVYYRQTWDSDYFLKAYQQRLGGHSTYATAFDAWKHEAVGRGGKSRPPQLIRADRDEFHRRFLMQFSEDELMQHYENWKAAVNSQARVIRADGTTISNVEVYYFRKALNSFPNLDSLNLDNGWDQEPDFIDQFDDPAAAKSALALQDPLLASTLVEPSSEGGKHRHRKAFDFVLRAVAEVARSSATGRLGLTNLTIRSNVGTIESLHVAQSLRDALANVSNVALDLRGTAYQQHIKLTPLRIGAFVRNFPSLEQLKLHIRNPEELSACGEDRWQDLVDMNAVIGSFPKPAKALKSLDLSGGFMQPNFPELLKHNMPALESLTLGDLNSFQLAAFDGDGREVSDSNDESVFLGPPRSYVCKSQASWPAILNQLSQHAPGLSAVSLDGPLSSGRQSVYNYINGTIKSIMWTATDASETEAAQDGAELRSQMERQILSGKCAHSDGVFGSNEWPWLVKETS